MVITRTRKKKSASVRKSSTGNSDVTKRKRESFVGVNGSLLLHELVIEGLKSPLQGIFIQSLKTRSIKSFASRLAAFSSPLVFLPQTKAEIKNTQTPLLLHGSLSYFNERQITEINSLNLFIFQVASCRTQEKAQFLFEFGGFFGGN